MINASIAGHKLSEYANSPTSERTYSIIADGVPKVLRPSCKGYFHDQVDVTSEQRDTRETCDDRSGGESIQKASHDTIRYTSLLLRIQSIRETPSILVISVGVFGIS